MNPVPPARAGTIPRFCRYDLRTTDPEGARRFYAEAIGLDIPDGVPAGAPTSGEPSTLALWPLHEQARARGVPAHWLGRIDVPDVEGTVARLLERGAEQLGPLGRANDGAAYASVRDPEGAVFAVRAGAQAPRESPVVWHHLATRDVDRVWSLYADVFGWKAIGSLEVSSGDIRLFRWDGDGKSAGSMANTARAAGVHVHWLYFFSVTDLDAALARVRACGGRVPMDATTLPNGDRLVPCDDPQGAAFGLYQAPTGGRR